MFQVVLRKFQEFFERRLKGVSGKFQWFFMKSQRSFKEVSRVFKESVKGTKMERHFKSF